MKKPIKIHVLNEKILNMTYNTYFELIEFCVIIIIKQ